MRLNLAWSNIFCLVVFLVLWKQFTAGPASSSHQLSLIASGGDALSRRCSALPSGSLRKTGRGWFLERTALLVVLVLTQEWASTRLGL